MGVRFVVSSRHPLFLVSEHGLDLVNLVELNVCLGMTMVGVACLHLVQMRLVRMI